MELPRQQHTRFNLRSFEFVMDVMAKICTVRLEFTGLFSVKGVSKGCVQVEAQQGARLNSSLAQR